ncbi:hypothetical protein [Christensenella timonensis]|uniref:hypothetical protein n=1 Tax=Christensenella timonensis TaxID=1816678 RepID=UPI0012E7527E|nr:hypothetical protein [Christensenella timonensis]
MTGQTKARQVFYPPGFFVSLYSRCFFSRAAALVLAVVFVRGTRREEWKEQGKRQAR